MFSEITPKSGRTILRRLTFGFGAIIVCVWVAEFVHLPHLLYNDPAVVNVTRATVRSLLIAGVWLAVYLTTRRLVRRLHELEGFLHVCSWCRKVGHEDQWLTMEEYFGSQLSTETSHGICPACAQQQLARGSTPSVQRVPPPPAN